MAINSLSASSKGFSGLASGLDTESMVEQLLSGTQSKIDSTNQKITQLEYKQELYQSVISDLRTFQNTYFSYTNQESNLLSQSFFSSKTVASTSKAFSVTAGSSATVGNVTVNSITSLATTYKQTAKNTASSKITGTYSDSLVTGWKNAMAEEKLTIKVGNKSVEIAASDIAGKGSIEVQNIINSKLKDESGDSYAEVNFLNGKFTLTASDEKAAITVSGSEKVNDMLGIGEESTITGTGSAEMTINTTAVLPTITIEVDGVSKDISLNPYSDKGIVTQLNEGIKNAFGDGISVVSTTGLNENNEFGFEIKVDNASRKVTVTGDDESLAMLGMKNKASNKISLTSALTDAQFGTAVVGGQQKFTINGVDFSFSSDATISSIMAEINNSDAGVKVSYSSTTDKFTIESKTTGSRNEAFEISQSEGNLLTAMFGIPAANNYSGVELKKQMTVGEIPDDFSVSDATVNLVVNGKNVSLNISGSYSDADKFIEDINAALKTQFGTTEVDGVETANVKLVNRDGMACLETQDGYSAYVEDDSLEFLGFDSTVTENTTLAELGIKDDEVSVVVGEGDDAQTIKISASTTLSDMVKMINNAAGKDVASLKGNPPYIRLCGVEIPIQFIDVSGKLVGTDEAISLNNSASTEQIFDITAGSDAKMMLNGVEVVRSTNSFTIDGLTFNLTATTDEESTIGVTQDTDKIYDTVMKFVEDYNKLINTINGLLDADATYRDYDPLTTAQEDEMTESQIEKWNEKAKEGLLRNDSTLTSVLSSLRQTLYTKPEGGIALYELGITTSYFGTKDNLTIEDKAAVKSKIEENPDAVMKLFTDSSKGLATLLNKAVDNAAKSSTVSPGSLVRMAGSKGVTDTSSSIYKQTKELKEKLEKLEDQYETEYERYWKQFNSMESYISQMNSTSSYLSSITSYQ